ncbi:TetR/AcrR family transcriptional regulator [Anaerobacillus sp. CMMVII]|uniref:TetR/AcrR family transcriptional regulator n=1 Tax=Anaerobacillus sp. CMMVII TaxID=2755588 RepID=UPI0021B7C574|nr:TetR/AcrR family transcriptional regulator [Anaerobacillus sp. CMMVII]MCT8140316.1 TetR/AcrR family transcriptional regulator [Anaerobacillus sp. CMMVII]
MNKSSKDKIVETASRLFQTQGYHATGLNQITKESGAPKGSLYYYFPDGKEQLASIAVESTAKLVASRIKEGLKEKESPIEAIQTFITNLADEFEKQEGSKQGLPVAAVVLETAQTSETLRMSCKQAYETWHEVFAKKLIDAGYEKEKAYELGLVINALIEGAFIIALTRKDSEPLRQVARYIPSILK